MTVRADVAELLHAGYGDRTIARQLGVTEPSVAEARGELGLASGRPGPKATDSIEDRFWRRAQPTDDGHLLWPVYTARNGSVIKHGGGKRSVHRVAFQIGNGREPQGHVTSGCGRTGCVHPRHVEDQLMRNQYNAIFGSVS
jgi:hypothetical protein